MRNNGGLFRDLPSDSIFSMYLYFFVAAALILGGATQQGGWAEAYLQILSLPLLGTIIYNARKANGYLGPFLLVLLIGSLPLLQLIPMPPQAWSVLPGRQDIVRSYQTAGMALPWLPISLQPAATWRSALFLLPAAAVFISMLCVDDSARRNVVLAVLLTTFLDVILSLLQIMSGPDSSLRFYLETNVDRAVGLFANSNHNAALLYSAIPLTVALGTIGALRSPSFRAQSFAACLLMAVAIVVALAITHSRAGLIFGMLASVSCIPIAMGLAPPGHRRRVFALALCGNLAVSLLFFQFGFNALADRLQGFDLVDDLRWPLAAITLHIAEKYLPFGGGFGTFVPLYQHFEPNALLREQYINRAHNDWLETWMEGGLLSAGLLAALLGWFLAASIKVWRQRIGEDFAIRPLRQAGTIIVGLLGLHSLLDYPLRTTALSVVVAIAGALLANHNTARVA